MNKTPSSWAKIDTLDPFDKPTKAEFAAFVKCYEALPQFTEFDPDKPFHTTPRIWRNRVS